MAEIVGDKNVDLQTDIYVNKDANSVQTRAAADNIPEYAAKYIDDNNVVHPAAILLTAPNGYDIQLDVNPVRQYFVNRVGREPAQTKEDILLLTEFMQYYAKMYCENNPSFMKQFDPTIVPYLIKYGDKGVTERDRERAAYETMLRMKIKYGKTNFTKIDWNQYVTSSVASHIRWTYKQVESIMVRFGH